MEDTSTETATQHFPWAICRVCLKSSNKLQNIFNTENQSFQIRSLEICGGVRFEDKPSLSPLICDKCFLLFQAAQKFRLLCQRSLKSMEASRMEFEEPQKETNGQNDEEIDLDKIKKDSDEVIFVEKVNKNEVVDTISISDSSSSSSSSEENEEEVVNMEEHFEISIFEDSVDGKNNKIERKSKVYIVPSRKTANSSNYKIVPVLSQQSNEQNKMYLCNTCGNLYNERNKLTLHQKIHLKEKPHECEICHKQFITTPQLARHMNSHTGNRPFKCDFCDASFADPSTCIKHKRIHTKEKPYKCDYCTKAFAYSNVLKVHQLTHSGLKPYACDHCGKKFSQMHHKKTHQRRHTTDLVVGEYVGLT